MKLVSGSLASLFGLSLAALTCGCLATSQVAPQDVEIAAASMADPAVEGVAIRVAWQPPAAIPPDPQARAGYVVGYEIYRSLVPQVAPIATNLVAFIEGGRVASFIDSTAVPRPFERIELSTDDDTGIVAVNRSTGSGVPSASYSSDSITYEIATTPPQAGQTYFYALRVVSKKLGAVPFDPVDGTPNLGGQLLYTRTYQSNQATALERPALLFPPGEPDPGSRDVDLVTCVFQWEAVANADTYVLELSTDRSFPSGQVTRSTEYLTSSTGGGTVSRRFEGADLGMIFRDWRDRIYWRVGARNSRDPSPPVDRNGKPVGYVFAEPRSFYGIEGPPPGP